ncbi:MAG: DUF1214 domain-containing protein, partial [Pseudomonadales bacterium]
KETGDAILRPETPGDAFNRAEGFRYLTRLLRVGLESNVEFSDPRFPVFYSLAHETAKIGNDNPDNFYQNCNISGQYDYRIIGTRGTVPYLSIETKAGHYGTTGGMAPTGHIESSDLEIASDGSLEIIVSATPKPRNWLPMQAHTDNLLVRQTFHDRGNETKAELRIECLNADGNNYLQAEAFVEQLRNTTSFVRATANIFVDWMAGYSKHINQLPSDDQARRQAAGGDSGIHYLQSYWQLAAGEALVVQAKKIPRCRTWNFQLSNFWMESLDYRYHKISVNKHTAHYEDDGSVNIVVAHSDPGPGYPNWLTTAGHELGGMLFRWVEADEHPPVDTKVVKLTNLIDS